MPALPNPKIMQFYISPIQSMLHFGRELTVGGLPIQNMIWNFSFSPPSCPTFSLLRRYFLRCVLCVNVGKSTEVANGNKKGTLSLICGVVYIIFDKYMHHDIHSFCLFTPLLRQSVCLFSPLFETKCLPFHPQKTLHGKLRMVLQQQQ